MNLSGDSGVLIRQVWKSALRMSKFVTVIGALVGATAVFPWVKEKWIHWTDVHIDGSFPGETWKHAALDQFSWLQDEWCFPSIPGFRSRFRLEGQTLERQNSGTAPGAFVTEWVKAKVHISNRGVLRIDYANSVWPISFVEFTSGQATEWRENERYPQDDGTSLPGRKRLVLSCSRCQVARDGLTYSCH